MDYEELEEQRRKAWSATSTSRCEYIIPKVIHQIWLGDQSKRPNTLMQTWIDKNPTWEYKLWTEANLPELQCKEQFDAMQQLNGKADILRYEILFNEGGFYIDADSKALEPLDDFLLDNDSFCCWENEYVRTGLMACGYLGATKGNTLMETLVEKIKAYSTSDMETLAWLTVGPQLLTDVVKLLEYSKLTIYPSWYFIPKHYTGVTYEGSGKVYGEQYFMSTGGDHY